MWSGRRLTDNVDSLRKNDVRGGSEIRTRDRLEEERAESKRTSGEKLSEGQHVPGGRIEPASDYGDGEKPKTERARLEPGPEAKADESGRGKMKTATGRLEPTNRGAKATFGRRLHRRRQKNQRPGTCVAEPKLEARSAQGTETGRHTTLRAGPGGKPRCPTLRGQARPLVGVCELRVCMCMCMCV